MWIKEGPDTLRQNLNSLEGVFMKRFPISKMRLMLFGTTQESREQLTEYWRRNRRMRIDADIDKMTPDQCWDMLLSLTHMKDKDIKEKLPLIDNLTFNRAISIMDTIKKSLIAQGKDAMTAVRKFGQINVPSTFSCYHPPPNADPPGQP